MTCADAPFDWGDFLWSLLGIPLAVVGTILVCMILGASFAALGSINFWSDR